LIGGLVHSSGGLGMLEKPSTKVFDKTQEWIELERGKDAGLSKLSDEEIALQDRDNRQEIDF